MASNLTGRRDRTIIVGVDFGTTFSGVAWGSGLRPDRIQVIREWPDHAGRLATSGKVPTKLGYTGDGGIRWGFQVSSDMPDDEVLEHFKLCVYALDSEHVDKIQGGSKLTKGNLRGQDVDSLVADYLEGLGTYINEYFRRKLGDAVVDATYFHYVLTVPAIWSDRAKQRTVDAFELAMDIQGQNSVTAITEPEAAATCVIQNLSKRSLEEDDCFIVVDAGGGTVDLISYQIKGFHPSLSVSEAAQGSGGACGAAFLNERFEKMLTRTLGQEKYFDARMIPKCLEKWERTVKRRFSMEDLPAQEFSFPVHGLEDNKKLKIRRNHWFLSATEVFRIFDGVVLQVLKLVTDQRVATGVDIKAILLVGGFGQSTYLRERLEAHIGRDIPVFQPQNAWTAVVEGAVMRGLAQVNPQRASVMKVIDRKARKHYGFELAVAYNPFVHGGIGSKRRWDNYNERWEVDVMQWFIKKGDPVTESQPFTKDFVHVSRVNWGRPRLIRLDVFSDKESDVAPLAKNDSVEMLCAVEADLSHIPEDQIAQRLGEDGMMYYVIECDVEICYDPASTTYTLVYNGRRYNTVNAELV